MEKPDEPKMSDKELMILGKKLQQFYEMGYVNKKQTLYFTFLKGMAGGFGAFLGGTILIALLLWFLGLFDQVPLAQHLVDSLTKSSH